MLISKSRVSFVVTSNVVDSVSKEEFRIANLECPFKFVADKIVPTRSVDNILSRIMFVSLPYIVKSVDVRAILMLFRLTFAANKKFFFFTYTEILMIKIVIFWFKR